MIVVTHYQRLLNYIVPDFLHVLVDGRIVRSGGKELALELEERGYAWLERSRPRRGRGAELRRRQPCRSDASLTPPPSRRSPARPRLPAAPWLEAPGGRFRALRGARIPDPPRRGVAATRASPPIARTPLGRAAGRRLPRAPAAPTGASPRLCRLVFVNGTLLAGALLRARRLFRGRRLDEPRQVAREHPGRLAAASRALAPHRQSAVRRPEHGVLRGRRLRAVSPGCAVGEPVTSSSSPIAHGAAPASHPRILIVAGERIRGDDRRDVTRATGRPSRTP